MDARHGAVTVARSPRAAQAKRRRARLVLLRVSVLVVSGLLLWQALALALWFLPLRVRRVELAGLERLDRHKVLALAGVRMGTRIFRVPLNQVARRLAAHPAVQEAQVSRHLPHTIRISIKERPAAFVLQCGGQARFVDRKGRLFPTGDCSTAAVARLFVVPCWPWSPRTARGSLDCLRALERAGLKARTVSVASSGAVSARLHEGVLLRFGLPQDLEEKALRARLSLAGLPSGGVEYLDLSALSAVVWKPLPARAQAR